MDKHKIPSGGPFNTRLDLIGYKSMPKGFKLHDRPWSIGEEFANSVSHGIYLMVAIAAVIGRKNLIEVVVRESPVNLL